MLGVTLAQPVPETSDLALGDEHLEHRWAALEEAVAFIPPDHWVTALIMKAGAIRGSMPIKLRRLQWKGSLEF